MRFLEKIVSNPLLLLIIMLKDFIEIFNSLKSKTNMNNINTFQNYDWWEFFIKLTISIALWLVLKAYFKLKNDFEDKMKAFNTISFIRTSRNFIRSYDDVQFYKMPYESDDDFYKKLPAGGLIDKFYQDEYNEAKIKLALLFPNKTAKQIEELLSNFYNFTS